MKKETGIKLRRLIERLIREESTSFSNEKFAEVAGKLEDFFRIPGSRRKIYDLLRTSEYDSDGNMVTNLKELTQLLNSTSESGTQNLVRVALTR